MPAIEYEHIHNVRKCRMLPALVLGAIRKGQRGRRMEQSHPNGRRNFYINAASESARLEQSRHEYTERTSDKKNALSTCHSFHKDPSGHSPPWDVC